MESVTNVNKKQVKSRMYCAVKNCTSKSHVDRHLSFHRFPKPNSGFVGRENLFGVVEKIDKLEAWKNALNLNIVSTSMTICSLHFKTSDYHSSIVPLQRKVLKVNAIPSVCLKITPKIARDKSRLERRLKRTAMNQLKKNNAEKEDNENRQEILGSLSNDELCNNFTEMNSSAEKSNNLDPLRIKDFQHIFIKTDSSLSNDEQCNNFTEMNSSVEKSNNLDPLRIKDFQHIGVQVKTGDLLPNFVSFIKTDSQLSSSTGIENFKILNYIVNLASNVLTEKKDNGNIRMNLHDKIILTYVKLKQNVTYSFLAVLFQCYTPAHCSKVFQDTIKLVSCCLKNAIPCHVECSNPRIKSFKMMSDTMPVNLVPLVDDIMIVVCGTLNLSCSPIIKDDK